MTTKIAKSTITALALVMLVTSAGIASAQNAAGGGRGGNGGGSESVSIGSSADGGDGRDSGSVNEWTDRRRKKEPPKPKLKLVRLFSENCLWEKRKRPLGSSYTYRYIFECRKEVQQ